MSQVKAERHVFAHFLMVEADAEWFARWNPGPTYPNNPFFLTDMESHIYGDNKPKHTYVYIQSTDIQSFRHSEFPGSKQASNMVLDSLIVKSFGKMNCTLHAIRIS